jgi:adenylylsulfate kinase
MSKIILVFGLPGSGKTTLCKHLIQEMKEISMIHLNADEIRAQYDDWDFSTEGRLRQAKRMRDLAEKQDSEYVLCDFVCPVNKTRLDLFKDSYVVFLNTIDKGRFEDTNKIFEHPQLDTVNFEIHDFNKIKYSAHIISAILQYQLFVFDPPSS